MDSVYMPVLKMPPKPGTRIHFMRDGEVSEWSGVVSKVEGNTVLFADDIPVDIREGDEMISFSWENR